MRNGVVLSLFAALALLTASPSPAASNLNQSKSNINRIVYPTDLIKADQVPLLLADLDKLGAATEAKLQEWLPKNLERFGIDPKRVKKIVVLPADSTRKETTILLLTDPADEAAAMALARATTVKSSKSNSSD
jgi:hypothetical protein